MGGIDTDFERLEPVARDMSLEREGVGIGRYKTVITLVEVKDQPAAKDAVAKAYLEWAANLNDNEDFQGALKQVDEAGKNTGTDAAKKSVESAKTDTF